MALDLGEKRIGIAVSDTSGSIAQPLNILSTHEVMNNALAFRRLLEDYEVELLVIGLPLSLDGSEQAQATRIRNQGELLGELYGLPVEFADERLSSQEAKRILRQLGYSEKNMRGKTDRIAASIVLQAWLDSRQIHQD